MRIEDGKGTGYAVHVDKSNRLRVRGVIDTAEEYATNEGDSFNVNSGLITLTDASEQGILYIKNNETRDLHIASCVAILGPSTGGSTSDTTRVRIYKNPTTGTLISEQTAADTNVNRNFGSSRTLDVTAYKGDASATVTDGTVFIESLITPGNRVQFSIDCVLTQGDAIAITYEPNDSNTSMKVMAAAVCYLNDPDE